MKKVIMSEDALLHMGFPSIAAEKEKSASPCANTEKKPYICPKQIDNGKGTDNTQNDSIVLTGGQKPKKKAD